ncbi:MAG: tetratricopeptide repeat protein [Acidobacteria bacterium]|nr:tetratricopeptide repeat protein [Acidobacteriota bacterium]
MRSIRLLLFSLVIHTIAFARPVYQLAAGDTDILSAPKEFRSFVIEASGRFNSPIAKARAVADAFFLDPKYGGLGLTYDNSRTRTVAEVWRDRKANCISMTATYVAACRIMGVPAGFAEAPSISLWVRHGDFVFNERHMVASIQANPLNTVVADFGGLPNYGMLRIRTISEARFRSLFLSNRAVEELQAGNSAASLDAARMAIEIDPENGSGWNILGVIQQRSGDPVAAEASFRHALLVDDENGAACGNLEALAAAEGRVDEAAKFRKMGLKLRERDPYFHAFLAREAMAKGRNEDAVSEIHRAIRLQRMEPDFYLILAQAEVNKGERGSAVKAIKKAIYWSLPDQKKRLESKLSLLQNAA